MSFAIQGVDEHFTSIIQEGRRELGATIASLCADGAPLDDIKSEDIAWAVAQRFFCKCADQSGKVPTRFASLSGGALTSELLTPFSRRSEPKTWPLRELTLSVSCEQNPDWRRPGSDPISREQSVRAFEFVYGRLNPNLVTYLTKRFHKQIQVPEMVAEEAWVRVFKNYWSRQAQRQFLGLSQISTFVTQVGRFIALDEIEESSRFVSIDDEDTGLAAFLTSESSADKAADPLQMFIQSVDRQNIQDCLARLTAKQRIVAEMAWLKGERSKEIAEVLQITQAAVSQHLSKARVAMRRCMSATEFAERK